LPRTVGGGSTAAINDPASPFLLRKASSFGQIQDTDQGATADPMPCSKIAAFDMTYFIYRQGLHKQTAQFD